MSFNGLWPDRTGIVPKMWERPFWERRLASSGLAGYGAFADSFHTLEHSREGWAVVAVRQDWSSERAGSAFSRGLELGRSSFEVPHDQRPPLPRNEGCVLG